MRLIVTRPEPEAETTAAALRARGHEVLLAPMLRIEPVHDAEFGAGPWDAVLMTSGNAARTLAAHPRLSEIAALPVYVVGAKTGDAARAAGFARVTSADGDAADLAKLVAGSLPQGGRLLWLAAEDRSGLAQRLLTSGYAVETVETYRAVAAAHLPDAVRAALQADTVDGVLLFSGRSADAWLAATAHYNSLKCINFCLSARIAERLRGRARGPLRIAATPTEAALLDLVGAL